MTNTSSPTFFRDDQPFPPGYQAKLDAFEKGEKTELGGGKHTDIGPAMHLLPVLAVMHTASVLRVGRDKYGTDNWRGIPIEENVNHAMVHLMRWCATGDLEDLSHAACRVMFALEQEAGK